MLAMIFHHKGTKDTKYLMDNNSIHAVMPSAAEASTLCSESRFERLGRSLGFAREDLDAFQS